MKRQYSNCMIRSGTNYHELKYCFTSLPVYVCACVCLSVCVCVRERGHIYIYPESQDDSFPRQTCGQHTVLARSASPTKVARTVRMAPTFDWPLVFISRKTKPPSRPETMTSPFQPAIHFNGTDPHSPYNLLQINFIANDSMGLSQAG